MRGKRVISEGVPEESREMGNEPCGNVPGGLLVILL